MIRIIALFLLSFLCIFSQATLDAQENMLLTEFDMAGGYGLRLLHNDVNTDMLLLCVYDPFDDGGFVYNTKIRIVHLQREGGGAYAPVRDKIVFETPTAIQQLDWVYDPISQTYLVAVVNGEMFNDDRDIRLLRLSLKGKLIGDVKKLRTQNFEVNFPQICVVPKKTLNAPASARFLFVGKGGDDTFGDSGVVSIFLDDEANAIGKMVFAVKELESGGKPSYFPEDLVPSGDKKGFLLACEFKESGQQVYKPLVIRLTGNAKYNKKIFVGDNNPVIGSIGINQVSKKKFVVTWTNEETQGYWNSIVPGKLNKAKAKKLMSELPACQPDGVDRPYMVLCKPDDAKKTTTFFIGDATDRRIYQALMKKTGKTSSPKEMTFWSTNKSNFFFARTFDAAPVLGTDNILCAIALREGLLNVIGTVIKGD